MGTLKMVCEATLCWLIAMQLWFLFFLKHGRWGGGAGGGTVWTQNGVHGEIPSSKQMINNTLKMSYLSQQTFGNGGLNWVP